MGINFFIILSFSVKEQGIALSLLQFWCLCVCVCVCVCVCACACVCVCVLHTFSSSLFSLNLLQVAHLGSAVSLGCGLIPLAAPQFGQILDIISVLPSLPKKWSY
jgi:hypothetical protein